MRAWLWLAALAAWAAVGGAAGGPGGRTAPAAQSRSAAAPVRRDSCPPTPGERTMQLVNEERARQGLPPLTADTLLIRAARRHAEDMAARGFISHTGSDGSDPSQRLDAVGYLWIWVGENIAAGQETPEEVVPGWIRSEAHRENILSPDFVSAGVAMARSAAGEYGTYWAMVYAAADPPSAGAVPCHP